MGGGVMKLLTNGLTEFDSFMNKSTRSDGVKLIKTYWNQKQTKRGTYFLKFFACELLNFANVVGQIFFTDMFLGYQFQQFGRDVLSQIEEPINVRDDPLNRVFPKVAKCTFQKFGPSGSLQKHDALCVLPLNHQREDLCVPLPLVYLPCGRLRDLAGLQAPHHRITSDESECDPCKSRSPSEQGCYQRLSCQG